nr:hypothetical protein [Tanacetum cinerariifolium]
MPKVHQSTALPWPSPDTIPGGCGPGGFGSNGAGAAVEVFGGGGGGVEADALKVFGNVFGGDVLGGPWGLHCWKM